MRIRSSLPLLLLLLLTASLVSATAQTTPKAPAKKIVITAKEANLRDTASSSGKKLDTLQSLTLVEVITKGKTYTKVKTKAGKTGYILNTLLADSYYVSSYITGGKKINLRSSPSTNAPTIIQLGSEWPLRILDRQGSRVLVRDWEGDEGWAYYTYLSQKRFVVLDPGSTNWVNVREGPGMDAKGQPKHPVRFRAQKEATCQVMEEKDGWLRGKFADGDEGWFSANLTWGWYPEPEKPKKKPTPKK